MLSKSYRAELPYPHNDVFAISDMKVPKFSGSTSEVCDSILVGAETCCQSSDKKARRHLVVEVLALMTQPAPEYKLAGTTAA